MYLQIKGTVCVKNWPVRQTMWPTNHYMTCWIPARLPLDKYTHTHIHFVAGICTRSHEQPCMCSQNTHIVLGSFVFLVKLWGTSWLCYLLCVCVCVDIVHRGSSCFLRNLTLFIFSFLHFLCTLTRARSCTSHSMSYCCSPSTNRAWSPSNKAVERESCVR